MATTFSGILSRKAGRMNVNMNAQSEVSNPEVEVAVAEAPAPKPLRTTPTRQEAKAELRSRAQDVAPIPAPEVPTPTPAPKTKAKATPKTKATPKAKATPKDKAAPAPAEEKPRLTLMQYSERCLAIFGDTKPIKEQLKKLGGRFNPNLHPFGQATSVPGWVFPMKCQDDLKKLVG